MKNMEIFKSHKFGRVRTLILNNEPWFVGKDVAEILGYAKPENAIANHVDEEDKTSTLIQGSGSNYKSKAIIINESGLYSLVLSSKLPSAKEFKRWITHEVIPAIRQHGSYMTPEVIQKSLQDPDFMIQILQNLKQEQERNRVLEADNERMRPKEIFADAVSVSKDGILVGALAKLIHQNGVEIGYRDCWNKGGDGYGRRSHRSQRSHEDSEVLRFPGLQNGGKRSTENLENPRCPIFQAVHYVHFGDRMCRIQSGMCHVGKTSETRTGKKQKAAGSPGGNRQPEPGRCKKGGFGLMKRFYLVDDDFLDAVDDLANKVGDIDVYGHPVLDASAVMILGKDLDDLMTKRQVVMDKLDDGFDVMEDGKDDGNEDA